MISEPKEVKPSQILYLSAFLLLWAGTTLPFVDIAIRSPLEADTLSEILEWNVLTEWAVVMIMFSALHFFLGIKCDKHNL